MFISGGVKVRHSPLQVNHDRVSSGHTGRTTRMSLNGILDVVWWTGVVVVLVASAVLAVAIVANATRNDRS